jgi:transcriptional regulator PpsR
VEASFPVTLFPGTESLGDFDSKSVSMLVAAAGDIVMVIDSDGTIQDAAIHGADLGRDFGSTDQWLGQHWDACVTVESRAKTLTLLRGALDDKPPRWVQINHPSKRGADIPILYTALRVGRSGRILAIGRDLRPISTLQQKLVDAQQSMERDYLRLRHVETRYRLLFQMSSEAVLIVDSVTQKTLETNPAAVTLLSQAGKALSGCAFFELFDSESRPAIEALLTLVRTAGRADEVAAKSAGDDRELFVSAVLFRQDNASLFLIRVVAAASTVVTAVSNTKTMFLKTIEVAPDGFVLTSPDGRILAVNAAFLDMAQLATEEQARAGSLEQWLGRPGVDMNVMIATLRQRGTVSLFATTLRGEYGESTEVEITAVSVMSGGQTCYGFVIRNIGRRIPADSRVGRDLPRSVDQLTELIGRVPLKDLVREATDMIERLCIQAALELTGDNRASAAELLGLSRQSLYVKLRRHGLGDLAGEDDKQD